ncbi:MAG: sigma-70 family RNA polymerase sigma factor [Myxococcales bacterium FL481]|nr:MAG: sigma-70 family RNA polymerase sigma factor [Myxococcales bacterium FL481]
MSAGEQSDSASTLVEHYFRHEYGRLVSTLTRRFGAARLEAIEDAVQSAFERALTAWPRQGRPDRPGAWLTRVAVNRLVDRLRKARHADRLEANDLDEPATPGATEDMLVMLFACADERLAPRARLILCLKLLCGFSTREIAARLFMTSANVQKTLERGRHRLQLTWHKLPPPATATADPHDDPRLATVLQVLYLLFTEGASPADTIGLRPELCDEAIRLARILVDHPRGDRPATWALLALMHLHSARLPTQIDREGRLVPLPEQDRTRWDRRQIAAGFECLHRATRSASYSRYHGEAAIQVEHIIAPSFAETRWHEIVALYEALEVLQPSPVYALNRIVALAEAESPELALERLGELALPSWFRNHYVYFGALGELHRRTSHPERAPAYLRKAEENAPSRAERLLFRRRLEACAGST